ncbi:MAG: peptidoglycan DD-metalloendopeptidase family protein [Pseudomonadales bacterium]|nr:peptidoglycan DD-metalloendopeptidase family protein [Pseudomonadales bacterium]
MKLILFPRRVSQSFTLDTSKSTDQFMLIVFLLLPFVLGGLSFWLYHSTVRQASETQLMDQWQQELARQAANVEQTQQRVGDELSAMTVKVAELQARLMRLDALGEQVTQVVQLDNGEFDFSRRPAVGGPELVSDADTVVLSVLDKHSSLQLMLGQLVTHIDNREQQLAMLDKQLAARDTRLQTFVAGKPVTKGWLSSSFGRRTDPFSGKQSWHEGVDFAGKAGVDVIAVASGVVTHSGRKSGYGNIVELNHGNGYVTRYAHNDTHQVSIGDIVEKGQVIATMGSSGRSTGPHVHFEVLKNGEPMNPERYIYRASL